MLNLPKRVNEFVAGRNVLIAAIGGGYDIYGAMPLYYTLKKMGVNCYLSSYSLNPNIKTGLVDHTGMDITEYSPEKHLSRYLDNCTATGGTYDDKFMVSRKAGVAEMKEYYKHIVKEWKIDLIITMDGGVDSLMSGKEKYSGTIMEEFINFAALRDLHGISMMHSCVGFGTEIEEQIEDKVVFGIIEELAKSNAFFGSCSWTKNLDSYKFYLDAYSLVHETAAKKSHIHPRIINSVQGEDKFVDTHFSTLMEGTPVKNFTSPLMSIQWFFEGRMIIARNPYMKEMQSHRTILDTLNMVKSIPRI